MMQLSLDHAVHLTTPAKVNLTLAVRGRRDDGFHDIESWVVPIDLHDRLTLRPGSGLSLTVADDHAAVRADETNLVSIAARSLAKAAGREPDVAIHLEKGIPAGAGLGGGSSDAAAVLTALNDWWRLGWPTDRLGEIGAEIGSDVPFFLDSGPAILRGRGELIERLAVEQAAGNGYWLALVLPPIELSTAAVYRARQSADCARPPADAEPWRDAGKALALTKRLFNDLEPAAFRVAPALGDLHGLLNGMNDRRVRMTGSGSALFTLFDSQSEAETWRRAAEPRLDAGVSIRIVHTLLISTMARTETDT